MALGGPDSLDAVEPFLRNVRHGRPTPKAMVDEFRERYRRIGGKSPLLGISLDQARSLETRLNVRTDGFRCYVGMRHWSPYIGDVVARIRDDDIRRVVAVCLTPYYATMNIARVESWHGRPELIDAYARKAREALERFAAEGHRDPVVLFTAHSLPRKIMQEGDPYERELQETMMGILKQLPPVRTRLCYQSAGRTED